MSSSSHHSVIHKPPKGSHEEVELLRDGKAVDIDKGIASLIKTMWEAGLDTLFCCEGYRVPEGEDDKAWEWQMYRSYILMHWTDESFDYVQNLLKSFRAFNGVERTSWEISFDYHEDQGPRICIRFPKSDITKLLDWFEWKKDHDRN